MNRSEHPPLSLCASWLCTQGDRLPPVSEDFAYLLKCTESSYCESAKLFLHLNNDIAGHDTQESDDVALHCHLNSSFGSSLYFCDLTVNTDKFLSVSYLMLTTLMMCLILLTIYNSLVYKIVT